MQLTIRILGHDLIDIRWNRALADAGTGPSPTLEQGEATSYPVGFVAHMERPHEIQTPDRDW